MDRPDGGPDDPLHRKPHVRGDGPAMLELGPEWLDVNPTCVGMDRESSLRSHASYSKPHVRGDGPFLASLDNPQTL